MSSSSDSDDDSQDEVAALFNKSAMKQKQQQHQQHHKRRLSSASSSSPPPTFMPPPTIGGETKSSSSPTAALAASDKITTSNAADHNSESDDSDEDDDDDVPFSSRATKRSKSKKNTVDNRLAGMAQKRAIRERQLKVKLQQNWNSDDDDSDDDENGGELSSKNLTKSIDKGRIAITVETKVYDEDGNCCSMGNTNNINQENTFPNRRTTRSTAAAAAVAAGASQQPEVYELDDSSDDEKPAGRRGGRRPISAIDPATIVAAAQGTGVGATALLQARQVMMKLQGEVLDCDDDDEEEDDDDDLQCSSLPFDTSLNNNAPPPRLLQLNVLTTLEDLDGVVEDPKTVIISMLSNETFKGLKENLLEQLSLPKTSSVTLRFHEHALYFTQTPDTMTMQSVGGAMNGEPAVNSVMESGSTLHARVFGVSSKKVAATKKDTAAASSAAAASTAANFGPSLTLTLRSKDGQLETFKLRQKEPLQALADAYRTKKSNIDPSCRIVFQFDGQNLQMTQTPLQCDMENDDLIDVQVNE